MSHIFFSDVAYAAANQPGPSLVEMLILPVGFLFIMYFLIIRPQQKKQKEHLDLLSNLKAGDEVITSGGLIGRIRTVADSFVTVDVAANTSVKVTKASIVSLTEKSSALKSEAKPKK